jgi:hypothetical protein
MRFLIFVTLLFSPSAYIENGYNPILASMMPNSIFMMANRYPSCGLSSDNFVSNSKVHIEKAKGD